MIIGLLIGFSLGFIVACFLVIADEVKGIREIKKLRQLIRTIGKVKHIEGAGEILTVTPEDVSKQEQEEQEKQWYG